MNSRATKLGWAIAIMAACCACENDGDGDADVGTDETDVTVRAPSGAAGGTVSIDRDAAQAALNELTGSLDATVVGYGSASTATAGAAGAPATTPGTAGAAGEAGALTVPCAAGGDATVAGRVHVVPVPLTVDVAVNVGFRACATRGGSTLAGEIEFSQSVAAGAGMPLRVETIYQGDIALTGKVNARCSVDVNVLVDERGNTVQLAGEICGQDASSLMVRLTPHWAASPQ